AVLDYARQRGEYVDSCCDLFDEDDLDWTTVHPDALAYVQAWAKFREREAFQPIVAQAIVYHADLDYAGTADVYGLHGKVPTIVDRKCVHVAPAVRQETKDKRLAELAEKYAL